MKSQFQISAKKIDLGSSVSVGDNFKEGKVNNKKTDQLSQFHSLMAKADKKWKAKKSVDSVVSNILKDTTFPSTAAQKRLIISLWSVEF
jgi:hypothetical protein